MNEFFSNAPDIIREASQSPLGVLSLMILVLAVLGVLFFRRASERTRVTIFVLMFLGVASFGIAISLVQRKEPPAPGKTGTAEYPVGVKEPGAPTMTTKKVPAEKSTGVSPSGPVVAKPLLPKATLYTISVSADKSTLLLVPPSGEERHIAFGRDQVQKIFNAPDRKWSVAVFKVRGQQQYYALAVNLSAGTALEDAQVAVPSVPDEVHFKKKEVIMRFAGGDSQPLRLQE